MAKPTKHHRIRRESQSGRHDKTPRQRRSNRKRDADKPLPHNADTERATLGAIMVGAEDSKVAIGVLHSEDFFLPEHQIIFRRLLTMAEAARPAVDLVTLTDELKRHGELDKVGGPGYVANLPDGVARICPILDWVGQVKRDAQLRAVAHFGQKISDAALANGAELETIAASAAKELERICGEARRPLRPRVTPENGAAVLDSLEWFIRKYVVLSPSQAKIVAVWVLHTHAFDAADTTPYLFITSAEKQSGKTRLLEVLELVVARPWSTGGVTAAALARKVEADQPTLLLDEVDAAFGGEKEYAEALRGVLNTGYRAGGKFTRCVGEGSEQEPRDFATFCPKAIAGLKQLPDTVADRSIPILLVRRMKTELVAKFHRSEVEPGASALYDRAQSWVGANLDQLREARPDNPEGLSDRQEDAVEPLLAIADAARGSWPEELRRALGEVLTGVVASDGSRRVQLLSDIRSIFTERDVDCLPTAELITALIQREESPWSDLNHGKPITPPALARLLRPFGIAPCTIRVGEHTPKGYHAAQFEDAWARWLGPETAATPPIPPSEPQQPPHAYGINELEPFSSRNTTPDVASENDI